MTVHEEMCIFTVGHSNHKIERFLSLLVQNGIDAVADVRTSPRSKFSPQYNRDALSKHLRLNGLHYVFMGDQLGARREENECYVDGKANYDLVAKLPSFMTGLNRLRDGASRHRIALLCAEKDPLVCHRAILVGRYLRQFSISMLHILHDGCIETHGELEARMLRAVRIDGGDLLTSHEEAIELAYDLQGSRIAYTRDFKEIRDASNGD
jgi:uncharacterized protein (DUF488 family)